MRIVGASVMEDFEDLKFDKLLSPVAVAEDQLARLDEAVRRSPLRDGFVERLHFQDAVASLWTSGEVVHVEELVLLDGQMNSGAPSAALTTANSVLRKRRQIARFDKDWALSVKGLETLTGVKSGPTAKKTGSGLPSQEDQAQQIDLFSIAREDTSDGSSEDGIDPRHSTLLRWQKVTSEVSSLPPTLAAALLLDAWSAFRPVARDLWLGQQLVAAYMRQRGKISSHLPALNVGIKALTPNQRQSKERAERVKTVLQAMAVTADLGIKELARLQHAHAKLERKIKGRRSSSSLPAVIALLVSRPVVSASMVADHADLTPRGALNLIAELGVREVTGRGRYRAWGII